MEEEKSIEEIRKQKKEQLDQHEEKQQDKQLKEAAKRFLTNEAQSRLENVRTARPEQASMIEQRIAMLGQSQQVNGKIGDDQLKSILKDLNDKDSDYNIKYR